MLRYCENTLADYDVFVLDSTFGPWSDKLRRLGNKTGTEIFVTQPSAANEPTFKTHGLTFIEGVYWVTKPGTPFKVLKHPRCGGARLLAVSP